MIRASARPDAVSLDASMFQRGDLVNLVLQRSDLLDGLPNYRQLIRGWQNGRPERLLAYVEAHGDELVDRAGALIEDEFVRLRKVLDPIDPDRIADIGCGYGLFDLFAHRAYGCDVLLIDIEETDHRHFGFEAEGAAYSDLTTASAFLVANGVPGDRIATWNPEREELDDARKVDVAVSFLSCGFHFPVEMYMPFFRLGVRQAGAIILDLRIARSERIAGELRSLGPVETLEEYRNRRRVLVRREAGP